jgi:hypothetical protein
MRAYAEYRVFSQLAAFAGEIATTALFPWPTRSRVRVIVAMESRAPRRRSRLLTALDRGPDLAGDSAERALSRRWPDLEVRIVDQPPVRAIVDQSTFFEADVIVLGCWTSPGRGDDVSRSSM